MSEYNHYHTIFTQLAQNLEAKKMGIFISQWHSNLPLSCIQSHSLTKYAISRTAVQVQKAQKEQINNN